LTGLSFLILMGELQGEPTTMPVTEIFCDSWFWFILLFSSPVITMRLFALEKSSGTFETLMTTPVSDLQVVLAKFTAALFFYSVLWLPLLACMFILRYVAHDPSLTDPGTLCATFLGIFLLGALYMAIGCFASALSSSQIVAAMTSFALGLGLFILGYLADQFPIKTTWSSELLGYMPMHVQMSDFARGIIDTRYIVFYVSLALFFLFLTYRVVESRRWK
jgi:ABC-2 type transport system permease protein